MIFFKIMSVPFEEQATLFFFGLEGVARTWWGQLHKERKSMESLQSFHGIEWKNEFLINFYVPQIEPPNEREYCDGLGKSKVCLVKVKIEQLEACKGGEMTEVVASFKALNEVYEQLTLQLVVRSQAINEE